jgi:hypothetical protein
VPDRVLLQPHAQATVAAVDRVAGHPPTWHAGGQGPFEHRLAQLRLGLEAHVVGDARRPAARPVVGPRFGQVQVPVDQRDPTGCRVGQEDRNLAVLLLAGGAGVLALDPGRAVALLHKARLVQHQHRVGIPQLLNDVVAQVVADAVGVPPGAVEQPLHPVRGHLTGLLSQPPAVLALELAQQPSQVSQRAPARLHPPEPPADALVQLDQPVRPHPCLLLGLLELAARPRRAPRCLRHVARLLDWKAGNLPQPNCDCRTRACLARGHPSSQISSEAITTIAR